VSDANVEGERQGFNRLTLVKKMAVGAFAVPAIVSFQLDSLARAGTFSKGTHGCDHSHPNQTVANQAPEHAHPNQTYNNQSPPDHSHPNQTSGGGRDNKDCDHKPGHQYPNQTASNQVIAS
jgi:hypothetical protein